MAYFNSNKIEHYKNVMDPLIEDIKGRESTPCATCTEAFCCKGKKSLLLFGDDIEKISKLVTKNIRKKMVKQKDNEAYDCPFLVDNKCSIYEDRPLACYSYYIESDSPAICGSGEQIPIYDIFGTTFRNQNDGLLKSIKGTIDNGEELKDVVLNSLHRF